MTSRNLTEVFVLMRNNTRASRSIYADDRVSVLKGSHHTIRLHTICSTLSPTLCLSASTRWQSDGGGDGERLLQRSLHDAEEGLELRGDDCGAPPVWTDKLEETQYTISKWVLSTHRISRAIDYRSHLFAESDPNSTTWPACTTATCCGRRWTTAATRRSPSRRSARRSPS